METIFVILLLASLVALIVGLIKPSWVKMTSRKRVGVVFGIALITFFVLVGVTSPPASQSNTTTIANNNPQPAPATQVVATASQPVQPSQPAAPKTDEQKISDAVQSAINDMNLSGAGWSYRDTSFKVDDLASPDGASLATVDINAGDFLNKDNLMSVTGELSSKVYQGAFAASSSIYDVIIQYYGTTTDAYGNQQDKPVLRYLLDRGTFGKINWQNFNEQGLCDFLNQQSQVSSDPNANTICLTLANIQ